MTIRKMTELDLSGKRVLIREDLNVPIAAGVIGSEQRMRAAIPTLERALACGAAVIVMSHMGRPKEGEYAADLSLAPVAARLEELMNRHIRFEKDYLDGVEAAPGEMVLLENVRFNRGEKADDEALSRRYAALCDVFVMDAFGAAHRAQASTHGVARFAPVACAGPLLAAELDALARVMKSPVPPVLAIMGGSKVSSKLALLDRLCSKVDQLIPGGGIANTFITAAGFKIGRSLFEKELVGEASRLVEQARGRGASISIPTDVVVGAGMSRDAEARVKGVADVADDDMILDIGPDTTAHYAAMIDTAGTIVWNGPVGVFELDQFGKGTEAVARAVAASPAFSVVGGGDTIAALEKYGVTQGISYISTGGGAFLEFLEGKTLPAVAVLEERAD